MSQSNDIQNLTKIIRRFSSLMSEKPSVEKVFRELESLKVLAPPVPNEEIRNSRAAWNDRCKPLYALGFLEEDLARFLVLTKNFTDRFHNGMSFVFAADNEIIKEGVSQTGAEVTTTVLENMAYNRASVALLATRQNCTLVPVNLGCAFREITDDGYKNRILNVLNNVDSDVNLNVDPNTTSKDMPHPILDWIIRPTGARDFLVEDALTSTEVLEAITVGLCAAWLAKDAPYIVGGEMGIGNTSSSTAVAAALIQEPVRNLVGRGAGLSDAGLARKREVLEAALRNRHLGENPIAILTAVGGLDIAALTGLYLGARLLLKPVFLDGLITLVAAALAQTLLPDCTSVMFATHRPRERAGCRLLDRLELTAPLDLSLALGEGAGAYFYLPLLEQTDLLFNKLPTFSEGHVDAYEDFQKETRNENC